jgi:hypothetical protein
MVPTLSEIMAASGGQVLHNAVVAGGSTLFILVVRRSLKRRAEASESPRQN